MNDTFWYILIDIYVYFLYFIYVCTLKQFKLMSNI